MDEEIRHKIIHLALSLFKQYGTKSTTMEDIADALKISKKTLYMYFHSKKELLQATLDHNFALHERKIVEILSQDFTSLEKFMRIYEYAISFLVTYHPSYFYDIKKYHREIDKSYETRKKEMISNRILALLQKAQEDGEEPVRLVVKPPPIQPDKSPYWALRSFTWWRHEEQVPHADQFLAYRDAA